MKMKKQKFLAVAQFKRACFWSQTFATLRSGL